jgi:NTP pyrophosphatase (non-canonical NTP hydrolase)
MKYINKQGNIIDSGYVGDRLPISNARVLMVEELKKDMFLKLQKCQKTGKTDDWRELGLSVLFQRLTEELLELQVELKNIELDSGSVDFDNAKRECADVANYAAMIHDLLNGMELEAMHKKKKKNES